MKATHIDYQHPGHLRVVVPGASFKSWNTSDGWQETNVMCMSPSSSDYKKLNRPGLPQFQGKS